MKKYIVLVLILALTVSFLLGIYLNKLKQIKDSYYDIDTDTTYLYFSEDEKHNTAEFTNRLDVTLYTLQDI